jgi:aspartokinase
VGLQDFMGLSQIRINGIRLGSDLNRLLQSSVIGGEKPKPPLYRTLAKEGINISCLGLVSDSSKTALFCCHDLPPDQLQSESQCQSQSQCQSSGQNPDFDSNVCTVSVYPHNASLNTLGFLIGLFGKKGVSFQLVSSNAMISFVIDRSDRERVLECLEQEFDLPPTHTPFQQNFNDETIAFVKKRYPETRATYVEEKIKTYGIKMETGLSMLEISFNPKFCEHLEVCDIALQSLGRMGKKFNFTLAMTENQDNCRLFCLTEKLDQKESRSLVSQVQNVSGVDICPPVCVDLLSFHGPHFGDRFGIFNTAMACLDRASIGVLLAGCTGASICMALPATMGEKAILALAEGFDTP